MTDAPEKPTLGPTEVLEAIADPLIAMDSDGRIREANPAVQRLLGLSLAEMRELTCHDLCSCQAEKGEHHCFLREVVGMGKIYREEATSLMNLTGGEVKAMVTASPIIADGEIIGGVQLYRVLSRAGGFVQKLQKQATEDDLTGLVNRRELMRRMDVEIARALRHRRPLSVLMMDLDHFKDYNDTQGHLAGDEALKLASSIVLHHCRAEDIAGRYGGEEFFVVLPETSPENALLIAERIRRALAESEELDPPVTISVGVHTWSGEGDVEPDALIATADAALYEAKRLGRNRVEVAPSAAGGRDAAAEAL